MGNIHRGRSMCIVYRRAYIHKYTLSYINAYMYTHVCIHIYMCVCIHIAAIHTDTLATWFHCFSSLLPPGIGFYRETRNSMPGVRMLAPPNTDCGQRVDRDMNTCLVAPQDKDGVIIFKELFPNLDDKACSGRPSFTRLHHGRDEKRFC